MKVKPIHSKKRGTEVYHDSNKCTERNNIERDNVVRGVGGKKKCTRCKQRESK